MNEDVISVFLQNYPTEVGKSIGLLRNKVKQYLPGITEQLDLPAKMIAYCYGQRYVDMICTIFPSQKGVKLSFYRGVDFPDPEKVLKGNAKTTRYIEIKDEDDIDSPTLAQFLTDALTMYRKRAKML